MTFLIFLVYLGVAVWWFQRKRSRIRIGLLVIGTLAMLFTGNGGVVVMTSVTFLVYFVVRGVYRYFFGRLKNSAKRAL